MRQRNGQHRIAVGRRFGDLFRADLRVSAGLVFDNHGGLPRFGELLGNRAGHHVGQPAGRERNYIFDGAARFGKGLLGQTQARNARQGCTC